MEGKPRHIDYQQPYTIVQCSECSGAVVVTAAGNSKHKCSK